MKIAFINNIVGTDYTRETTNFSSVYLTCGWSTYLSQCVSLSGNVGLNFVIQIKDTQ